MAITLGAVHHITLTVTDIQRSKDFYTSILGLGIIADWGERILMGNGNVVVAITLPVDKSQALPNDNFSEHRCGLDHVSFGLPNLAAMEEAAALFDEKGVSRGDIRDLSSGGVPIYVMAFRDPDNIQLEFTAPK